MREDEILERIEEIERRIDSLAMLTSIMHFNHNELLRAFMELRREIPVQLSDLQQVDPTIPGRESHTVREGGGDA